MIPQSKYHRTTPVRQFDLNQTLYTTVFEQNINNMDVDAIGFLGKNITFKELKNNVDRLADAYAKIGVKDGETVGICTINMPIVQENLLALSKIGATSKWIDLRIKGKDLVKNINESNCQVLVVFDGILDAIMEIIDETDVSTVLVASPKDYLNPVIKTLANMKDKKEGKKITIPKDKRIQLYKKFLKTGDKNSQIKPVPLQKDRIAIIVQSSGSTGKAKSIMHTEYNFNASMQKEAYTDLQFAVGRTMHVAIPPFIIYGLNNSIYAALAFGMKAEMTPFVSETTVYDDLGKYDFSCAAPLHYRYLYGKVIELKEKTTLSGDGENVSNDEEKQALLELEKIKVKLSRVKAFVCGGDKISDQEILSMEHIFETPIINGYGNNELTGAAIISPVYANKPDSVGIPMKGITVATFEPDTFYMLNTGKEGEICIHSDSVFVGYLNNEAETKRIKQTHDDGLAWIHTGDLGYVDQDGYVYITGRAKRLIKREAFKIAPETIENVILEMESVRDCVVVGVTDVEHNGSFVPMAYAEVNEDKANIETIKADIMKKCQEELPDYEVPKYIECIEKIPYKNTKHNFKELETMGEEYVKQLMG
ncbi:MAG: acyl--CoA ligase [Lachnospiraceae bacterium]|nr:acyl--CoA ligase [Lachnospiraceae bacterium]